MRTFYLLALIVMALLLGALPARAETTLLLAVASNFSLPMAEIAPAFEQTTGIKIESSFASTGKLFAMIENGAPFDLFLAADSLRPEILANQGLAEKPFVYALGRPVLWSSHLELCEAQDWRQMVRSPRLRQIAIANPATAPYGLAVRQAIEALPDHQQISRRLVYTQNVGQAFQYAEKITGAGFTAASFARSPAGGAGCYLAIPESENVIQKGCAIRRKNPKKETLALISFLAGPEAGAIIRNFGYRLEQQNK